MLGNTHTSKEVHILPGKYSSREIHILPGKYSFREIHILPGKYTYFQSNTHTSREVQVLPTFNGCTSTYGIHLSYIYCDFCYLPHTCDSHFEKNTTRKSTAEIMSVISIEDFKAGKATKVPMLEVKVHKRIGETTYIVGDTSSIVELSTVFQSGPSEACTLKPGEFIRIVKPISTSSGIKLSTFQPTPIAPFQVKTFKEDSVGGACAGKPLIKPEELKTFVDFSNLAARSNIGSIVSKVVFVSPKKAAQFSDCRLVGLKDVTGKKSHVTLFGKFADMVESDKVYEFSNLTVQGFKGPSDEFNRLGSSARTAIKEATPNVSELFQNVLLGDGVIEGHILGYERLFHYKSCPFCTKKCDDDECCTSCQKRIVNSHVHDFNVTLQVMDALDDDEVKLVLAFRKVLTQDVKMEVEEIKAFISQLIGQRCRIEFEKDRVRKDLFQALKFTVENKRARKE